MARRDALYDRIEAEITGAAPPLVILDIHKKCGEVATAYLCAYAHPLNNNAKSISSLLGLRYKSLTKTCSRIVEEYRTTHAPPEHAPSLNSIHIGHYVPDELSEPMTQRGQDSFQRHDRRDRIMHAWIVYCMCVPSHLSPPIRFTKSNIVRHIRRYLAEGKILADETVQLLRGLPGYETDPGVSVAVYQTLCWLPGFRYKPTIVQSILDKNRTSARLIPTPIGSWPDIPPRLPAALCALLQAKCEDTLQFLTHTRASMRSTAAHLHMSQIPAGKHVTPYLRCYLNALELDAPLPETHREIIYLMLALEHCMERGDRVETIREISRSWHFLPHCFARLAAIPQTSRESPDFEKLAGRILRKATTFLPTYHPL